MVTDIRNRSVTSSLPRSGWQKINFGVTSAINPRYNRTRHPIAIITGKFRMANIGHEYNYDTGGVTYANHRQTDPRIAQLITNALGDARTVLNVGAGTGSYEPSDRYVIAVEPSSTMRSQRSRNSVPAVIATAESLPFDDNTFDASMATLTIHHWPDVAAGLQEMRRVTRGPIVLLTYDPEHFTDFWLYDYCHEMPAADGDRFPRMETVCELLGGNCDIRQVAVPLDCIDGFQEAFYGRPEMFLDPSVRRSQSGWSFVSKEIEDRSIRDLADDLNSGAWDKKYGYLRKQPRFDGALRIVVGYP